MAPRHSSVRSSATCTTSAFRLSLDQSEPSTGLTESDLLQRSLIRANSVPPSAKCTRAAPGRPSCPSATQQEPSAGLTATAAGHTNPGIRSSSAPSGARRTTAPFPLSATQQEPSVESTDIPCGRSKPPPRHSSVPSAARCTTSLPDSSATQHESSMVLTDSATGAPKRSSRQASTTLPAGGGAYPTVSCGPSGPLGAVSLLYSFTA